MPPGRRNHAVRGERRLSGWRQSQHAKLQRSPSFSLPDTANITRSPPDPLAAQPHRDADLLPDHQAHSPFPRTSHPLLTPTQLANRVRSTSPACPHHTTTCSAHRERGMVALHETNPPRTRRRRQFCGGSKRPRGSTPKQATTPPCRHTRQLSPTPVTLTAHLDLAERQERAGASPSKSVLPAWPSRLPAHRSLPAKRTTDTAARHCPPGPACTALTGE
jgi:hypothetical protein